MDRPLKLFRVVFWLCFVGLTGLALSLAPYLPPLDIFNWWDKAQHATGYGTLMASALLAHPKVSKLRLAALLCLHGCLIFMVRPLGHDASSGKEGPGAVNNSKLSATTTSKENTNGANPHADRLDKFN